MWIAWATIFVVSATLFVETIFLSVPHSSTSNKTERTKSHG